MLSPPGQRSPSPPEHRDAKRNFPQLGQIMPRPALNEVTQEFPVSRTLGKQRTGLNGATRSAPPRSKGRTGSPAVWISVSFRMSPGCNPSALLRLRALLIIGLFTCRLEYR